MVEAAVVAGDLTKDLGTQTRSHLTQMWQLCTLDLKVDPFAKKGILQKDTRPGDVVPINAADLVTDLHRPTI